MSWTTSTTTIKPPPGGGDTDDSFLTVFGLDQQLDIADAIRYDTLGNDTLHGLYTTVASNDADGSGAGSLNYYYASLELAVALAATLGNAAVITVFCRERRLRKRTNYYIVSLAMADFLVGLLGIPFAILASVGLPRNLYGCLLTLSTLVVLCTISIFCLVAVSIDRYWAILHPLAYSRTMRTKTAIGMISICWVLGIFVGFLPLLGWRAVSAGPKQACLFVKVMDYNYLVFLYFTTIVLPALMLLFFYSHIYTVIMKQVRKTVHMNAPTQSTTTTCSTISGTAQLPQQQQQFRGGGGHQRKPMALTMSISRSHGGTMLRVLGAARKREVKATQNLSVIVLFFMLCWLPLYTINCVQAFCPTCHIEPWLMLFLIILSHLNSALNPLLYAYHLKDFRAALKALLCRLLGLKVPQEEINYRFSVFSQQTRAASRLEMKRTVSMMQPKIYIDSPVYHRQQANSRSTSPLSSPNDPGISSIAPHRSKQQQPPPHRHTANDLQIWRIVEVSTAEETKSTSAAAVSGTSGPSVLSAIQLQHQQSQSLPPDDSPFDKHEYLFNYDPLDATSSPSLPGSPETSNAKPIKPPLAMAQCVTHHIARQTRPAKLLRMQSEPVESATENRSLSVVRYTPRHVRVPVPVPVPTGPLASGNFPPLWPRRAVTMCGDLRRNTPATRTVVGVELNAAAAPTTTTSTAELTHGDYQVLRMETQLLIEEERRAEVRSRNAAAAAARFRQQQYKPPSPPPPQPQLQQQSTKVRHRRRRRSRSTSYDRDRGDGAARLHRKYSRSWSALAQAQAQEDRRTDIHKRTFS